MEALRDDTFRRITDLMYSAIGLSFTDNKKPLISSRLAPRIQRLGLDGYEDYLALITQGDDGGEFQVAVDLLTTNETYFFREPAHYDLLEQELTRNKPQQLSVWSAASSFGDEAYSTAMLLSDLQQQGRIGSQWKILGTDISDRVLRSAIETVLPTTWSISAVSEVSREAISDGRFSSKKRGVSVSRCACTEVRMSATTRSPSHET